MAAPTLREALELISDGYKKPIDMNDIPKGSRQHISHENNRPRRTKEEVKEKYEGDCNRVRHLRPYAQSNGCNCETHATAGGSKQHQLLAAKSFDHEDSHTALRDVNQPVDAVVARMPRSVTSYPEHPLHRIARGQDQSQSCAEPEASFKDHRQLYALN